jgi:hypothetical protein
VDQLSEKLLSMIEHGLKMFALEAKKELDSIEGVPGTPGVRQAAVQARLVSRAGRAQAPQAGARRRTALDEREGWSPVESRPRPATSS